LEGGGGLAQATEEVSRLFERNTEDRERREEGRGRLLMGPQESAARTFLVGHFILNKDPCFIRALTAARTTWSLPIPHDKYGQE
jgi:hypothetical protein